MYRRRMVTLFSIIAGLILAWANVLPNHGAIAVTSAASPLIGYADFTYSGISTPTGEKPQSKLWFNDGRWWASMFHQGSNTYHIFWLDLTSQQWQDTGTQLDSRPKTKADCLWDGTHLYVASGGGSATGANLDGVLYRYSYNASSKTYSKDFGPVTIRTGGAETIVLDKDGAGKLWITYTQGNKVYVNHSDATNSGDPDADWQANNAYIIPASGVNTSVAADDISSLIAFDGKVGVLWSNQSDKTFYYAVHADGDDDATWSGGIAARQAGSSLADDHINLKSLQSDASGQLFAVVKTSINGSSSSTPQIMLLVRKVNGSWSATTVSSGADNQTRPFLLIDTDHRQLYVFESDEGGGSVYYKQSGMDNIQFASGKGTPFISGGGYSSINDSTSTKQNVSGSTGIVVLASDDSAKTYLHNYLDLSGGQQPRLVFSTQPGGAYASAVLTNQPVIAAQDTPGHTNSSFNGAVTLAIKSGTGTSGATLAGTLTVNAVNGVASFSGLAIDKAGASYQLNAVATGFASATSNGFSVAKADQTITFGALPDRTFGDAPFGVSASASSGLPVSFSVSGACSIASNTVTLSGSGTCTVTAHQAGDANHNPAPDVARTFTINGTAQTITFSALPDRTFGDAPFGVSASASSGLPVSFSAAGNCTIAGATVTLTGAGSCSITARQPGDVDHTPAPDVTRTFTIAKASQTISFGVVPNHIVGDAPFDVTASASSGLPVSFSATGNCRIAGSRITIMGAGNCAVTARQAGSADYQPAPAVVRLFKIGVKVYLPVVRVAR
jgi:hypothetical protein